MRTRRVIVAGVVVLLVVALALWWGVGRGRGGRRSAADGRAIAGRTDAPAHRADGGKPDPRTLPPGEVRGTVRERDHGPLAGAQVCAGATVDAFASDERRDPVCVVTDVAGGYRLVGLIPGPQELSAGAAGHQPQDWTEPVTDELLELAAGEIRSGVDFALATGGVEVQGVVSDLNGGPIADAWVSTADWNVATASARADAQGRFTLWTRPGALVIAAEAEGYAAGQAEAVAPAHAVEILLSPASSLGGVVIDAVTRAPVAGVHVELPGGSPSGDDDDDGGAVFWSMLGRAQTDAAGRFRFDRLKPGRYKPYATGPGVYGQATTSVMLGLGQRVDDVVIEVSPAASVRGRIEVAGPAPRAPCTAGWVQLLDHARDDAKFGSADDDGQVVIDGVRPGRYEVSVTCGGFVEPDDVPAIVVGTEDVTGQVWTFTGGGSVRGVVRTATGEPVAGAEVWAQFVGPGGAGSYSTVSTRADGGFVITGLRAGEYEVRVDADDHRGPAPPPRVTVTVGHERQVDVVLPVDGAIAGIVVDTDERPVAGVGVRVGEDGLGDRRHGARTGEDGRFVIRGVEPGLHHLAVGNGWYQALRGPGTGAREVEGAQVKVVAGKTAIVRLVVESQRGVITGTVMDDQGQAVTDAWVVAGHERDGVDAMPGGAVEQTRWSWGRAGQPVATDLGGGFAIRDLAPGTYTLRAYRRGGGEAVVEHVAVGGKAALVIRATGTLAGVVAWTGGGGPDEFAVAVADETTAFGRRETFYRTGGRFALRDLPAGDFVVTVTAAGGHGTRTISLAAGQQRTDLRLVLDALLTVRGRVVDFDSGAPVAGVRAEIRARVGSDGGRRDFGDVEEGAEISGADGRFEVAQAPAGEDMLGLESRTDASNRYGWLEYPIGLSAGAGVVDLGDLRVVAARMSAEQPAGSFGMKLARWAPDATPPLTTHTIISVGPGGPADRAGVRAGDVIVAVDGHDIRGAPAPLLHALLRVPVGTAIAFGLARGVAVTVTAGPTQPSP